MPDRSADVVGIDGTGFSVENRSKHYEKRAILNSYRRYVKLSITADLDKQLIMRQSIHKSPRHDNKDFMILMHDVKTKTVCADKGYDSNENHRFVIQDLEAKSLISIKDYGDKKHRNWRKDWRRIAKKQFDEEEYHQRSKMETIFSCVKRKYGSNLRSKDFYSQKKELLCKLIAYNIDRVIKNLSYLMRVSAEPEYRRIFIYILIILEYYENSICTLYSRNWRWC